ncbi:activating signal cointegrator complex subunit 1, partial [Lecanoromycetidae sp. Uapishka_2]
MPPRPQLTHFLCLPLVNSSTRPQWQASIQRFTAEVSGPDVPEESRLSPKAIRPVGAIHLTLGVMSLLTPERVEAACTFLRSLDMSAILRTANDTSPNALDAVTFRGLEAMSSPSRTSVLYAATNAYAAALLPFSTYLRKAFTVEGFMVPEDRDLKIHATVVNTIYARETKSGKKRWGKGSGKFDATELVQKYKDWEWVKDMRIENVAICKMGAENIVEGDALVDQVYTEVASVPLVYGD